jgi:hypothetical protein
MIFDLPTPTPQRRVLHGHTLFFVFFRAESVRCPWQGSKTLDMTFGGWRRCLKVTQTLALADFYLFEFCKPSTQQQSR